MQCKQTETTTDSEQVKYIYAQQLTAFCKATDTLLYKLERGHPAQWKLAFNKARLAYKQIEIFVDYYYPSTAKGINGPPVKEVEADDPIKEMDPSGFQVIEENLFPTIDTSAKKALIEQAKIIQSLSRRLQNGFPSLAFSDSHVFDALRLHLLRIISMNLAGGDNGIAQNSVSEAVVSLQSFRTYVALYNPGVLFRTELDKAVNNLQQDTSFADFDRAAFITEYAGPIWNQLYALQEANEIPFLKEVGLVNTLSSSLFDSGFFNTASFSQQRLGMPNAYVIETGRRLFSDQRLSGNGLRSCASCHQPKKGYADNRAKNTTIDGTETIFRNTPTILYASLQPLQFADGRVSFLEDQAKNVIENHSEMQGDLKTISRLLAKDTTYQRLSEQAFKKPVLDAENITNALAAFVQAQTLFTSSFDDYLKGNKTAISATTIKGFNLFMGKAKCGTCHFMPLFNGVVPPHFNRMESEVLGVPTTNKPPFTADGDEGKFRLTGAAIHRYAFKTPTLRNIQLTAPYMHNGIYRTLEEVIDFYDKGGGAGLGITLPNQTLPAEPLNLTRLEKEALIEFLKSLNDK